MSRKSQHLKKPSIDSLDTHWSQLLTRSGSRLSILTVKKLTPLHNLKMSYRDSQSGLFKNQNLDTQESQESLDSLKL